MARWGLWTASAIGAAGAGAAVALLRRRRTGDEGEVPAGAPERAAPADAAPAPEPPEDPRAALDAARDRLRARADELRGEIAGDGEGPAPG
jgi:hypothetical protein